MRTKEDKDRIISNFSNPVNLEGVISQEEISELIAFFHNHKNKTYKNTGPVTIDLTEDDLKLDVFKNILEKAKSVIGEFEVSAALFFYVETPHIIHNDDTFELLNVYKGINIPLEYNGSISHPFLCFFNQYYLEGPAKFFNGDKDLISYYNVPVYEYSSVQNLSGEPFPENIRKLFLSHIKPEWLQGLSFDRAIPWKPGNMILFDSVKLHCASNFKSQGITSKLGLSIFTKKSV
jgi:hypothetical protein